MGSRLGCGGAGAAGAAGGAAGAGKGVRVVRESGGEASRLSQEHSTGKNPTPKVRPTVYRPTVACVIHFNLQDAVQVPSLRGRLNAPKRRHSISTTPHIAWIFAARRCSASAKPGIAMALSLAMPPTLAPTSGATRNNLHGRVPKGLRCVAARVDASSRRHIAPSMTMKVTPCTALSSGGGGGITSAPRGLCTMGTPLRYEPTVGPATSQAFRSTVSIGSATMSVGGATRRCQQRQRLPCPTSAAADSGNTTATDSEALVGTSKHRPPQSALLLFDTCQILTTNVLMPSSNAPSLLDVNVIHRRGEHSLPGTFPANSSTRILNPQLSS